MKKMAEEVRKGNSLKGTEREREGAKSQGELDI